jgi:hypothetical protein
MGMTLLERLRMAGMLAFALTAAVPLWAQQTSQEQTQGEAEKAEAQKPEQQKPESRMTPAQAKELFASVDTILEFASDDSKLAIKSKVKRRLTSRDAVEKYLIDKMKDDKDAKRMERSEIVLKKFGLIDQDFHLQTFLVSLLK